jgi:hypothetical protein
MNSGAWNAESIARLKDLVEAGEASFKEIGQEMGLSKNIVIGKARREGFVGPKTLGPRDDGVLTLTQRLDALDVFPGPRKCVFPIGHPRAPNFHFCAARADEGAPYCPEHRRIALVKVL